MRFLSVLLLSYFLAVSMHVSAVQDEHKKLTHVIAQIQDVKKKLKQHQIQQSTIQHELHKTAVAIHVLKTKLQKTLKQMQSKKENLYALNNKRKNIEDQIIEEKQLLGKQLLACYLLENQHDKFKAIFHNEESNKIERMTMYSRYLNLQRLKTIQHLTNNLVLLGQNKKTIEKETQQLNVLQSQQKQSQQQLIEQKQTKAQILQSIHVQLITHTQQLNTLILNKKKLETKIKELANINIHRNYLTNHTGKFPWPAKGEIVESYGTPIAHSQLTQTGVLINTPSNEPVIAVAPGKVIFANAMAGYGLLLIIAHGNGYMSLYGNNEILYKKVNDTVKMGDLIGRLGHHNAAKAPALYFGVRKNGKPIDPRQWCDKPQRKKT